MNPVQAPAEEIMTALIAEYEATPASEADAVLAARRTVRRFAGQPVGKAVLEDILTAGDRLDRRLFAEDRRACGLLETVVVARDVTGLPTGVHTVAPELAGGEFNGPLAESAWRAIHMVPTLCTAPVLIVPTGNLAAADRHFGAHGHLRTRRRAGAIAYAMWLAALAAGLAGGMTGALRPDHDFRRVSRFDPLRRCPLTALAIGYPQEAGA